MTHAMAFQSYAYYYDLIYKEKDYKAECQYIENVIRRHACKFQTILDLGCGTGIHDNHMANSGYGIVGIDISPEMIEIAKTKRTNNCEFILGDATKIRLEQKFDVVISLFHVVSYQISNSDLRNLFDTAKFHLKPGGLFIFDFWYSPAVYNIKPSVKIKRVESNEYEILRIAEPENHTENNIVNVNFEFHILQKSSGKCTKFRELHKMRHFSIPEIECALNNSSLRPIAFEEWLSGEKPSEITWSVCCVSRTDSSLNL